MGCAWLWLFFQPLTRTQRKLSWRLWHLMRSLFAEIFRLCWELRMQSEDCQVQVGYCVPFLQSWLKWVR